MPVELSPLSFTQEPVSSVKPNDDVLEISPKEFFTLLKTSVVSFLKIVDVVEFLVVH
jgi:hypothetical protein